MKLTFGGDKYNKGNPGQVRSLWVTPEPATLQVGTTEADLSDKNLGVGGAIIVGAWISHKDNGALTSLNMSDNQLAGYYKGDDREWIPDMTGINALAAAIPACK